MRREGGLLGRHTHTRPSSPRPPRNSSSASGGTAAAERVYRGQAAPTWAATPTPCWAPAVLTSLAAGCLLPRERRRSSLAAEANRRLPRSSDLAVAQLRAKQRKKLPRSAFAYPSRRAYPIDTKARARNALARAAQKGTSGSYSHVARAVRKRYGNAIASVGKKRGTVTRPAYRRRGVAAGGLPTGRRRGVDRRGQATGRDEKPTTVAEQVELARLELRQARPHPRARLRARPATVHPLALAPACELLTRPEHSTGSDPSTISALRRLAERRVV
jgi:hypothetical protein